MNPTLSNQLLSILRRLAAWAVRHRSALLFGVALLFGALAVLGARGYIAERLELEKARLQPPRAMGDVVVARRDLARGDLVTPESMAVREVPLEYLPRSAVRPERFEQFVGARLDAPMRSGEPLLAGSLVGADASTFSSRIRDGIRAMSVLVDEVNSVSGMLQPGDRIDLLFSVRPPSASGQPLAQEVTVTLMQDLAVLATGRQVRAGAEDGGGARHFTAITVEVSPEQAQRLIVAQRAGKLTAMLRHPEDRRPLATQVLDLNTLLGLPAQRRPAAAPPHEIGPDIIVGGRGALVAMNAPWPGGAAPTSSMGFASSPSATPVPEVRSGVRPGMSPLVVPAWMLHRPGGPVQTSPATPAAPGSAPQEPGHAASSSASSQR